MAADGLDALREKLRGVLPQVQDLLAVQARTAIDAIAAGSDEAGKIGLKCLEEMSRVGQLLADGEISQGTAAQAIAKYADALDFAGKSVLEKAASEAYDRGVALLRGVGTVFLEILGAALKVGLAEASAFAGSIKVA